MNKLALPVSSNEATNSSVPNSRAFRYLAPLGAVALFLSAGDWRDDSVANKRFPGSRRTVLTTKEAAAPQDGIERFGAPASTPTTQKQPENPGNQPSPQPQSTIPFDNPTSEDLSNEDEY